LSNATAKKTWIAVDGINRPGDQMAAKQLIGGISPSPAEAADPSFDLRSSVKKVDSAPA